MQTERSSGDYLVFGWPSEEPAGGMRDLLGVVENLDNDPTRIFRQMYDGMYNYFDGGSIPRVVLILADYQYKAAFVADAEINMTACLVEIMMECDFK